MERVGISAADLTVVNSNAIKHELRERPQPSARRIEVVPNGVDLQAFRPAFNWPQDAGYVLFVGRLVAQKGVDVLLRAFAAVLRQLPAAKLLVVGDGELQLYLQRVVRHLGFPHKVTFRPWQAGSALVDLYQQAQVVVVPSHYEPFGIVALEAMACGRPVIATRVGGLAETIRHGKEGYLTPPADHLRLAQYIVRLLRDKELRVCMGEAARSRAQQFSWARAAEETIKSYASLPSRIRERRRVTDASLRQKLLRLVGPGSASVATELMTVKYAS
jgi:1,4-alpha-glucan branching enzyme